MKDGHQSTKTQNNRIQQKREKSWDKTNIWRHVENKFKNFEDFRLKAPKSAKEDNFLKIHTQTYYSEILECKDKILNTGEKEQMPYKGKKNQTDVRFSNNTGCKWVFSKNWQKITLNIVFYIQQDVI